MSKVREIIKCDNYEAMRCIYSDKILRNREGPSQNDIVGLGNQKVCGYVCGNKLKNKKFLLRRHLSQGDQLETYVYSKDTHGDSVPTAIVGALCSSNENIVKEEEVTANKNVEGYRTLPIC